MFQDEDLSSVLEPAIQQNVSGVNSLRELYENKKKELGLSDRKIQELLEMQHKVITPIIDGTAKQINLVNFIKVANFLGVNFEELAKAYLPTMESSIIGDIQRARDAGYIAETFDIKELTQNGFFQKDATVPELRDRITSFFGISSIYGYGSIGSNAAFSRTRRTSSDKMREFWVRSAYVQFQDISNPNPYDRGKLLFLIPHIRPYSRNEEKGMITVFRALYAAGVTAIYQPCLGKEQVRGATMNFNKKPCIVLSNLNKKYPTLWFALMHELYHVLFDFDEIIATGYHVSDGVGDLLLTDESKADSFAQQYLLSNDKERFINYYIDAPTVVEEYAEKWGVHPSVIYATYCYKHSHCWSKYSSRIPNMEKALKELNTSTFEAKHLVENAQKIKELLTV